MSGKKQGRPFKNGVQGADSSLQCRLSNASQALSASSSLAAALTEQNVALQTALREATGLLSRCSQQVSLCASAEVLIENELAGATTWYARLEPDGIARLLMEPDSLHQEFQRFLLWMPNFMAMLARTMVVTRPDNASNPNHKHHATWYRAKSVQLHLAAAKILRSRSQRVVPLVTIAKAIDRFYKAGVHTEVHISDQRVRESLHNTLIQKVRNCLSSWVPVTPFVVMKKIRFITLDNWDEYCRLGHAVRVDGEVKRSQMLHAILICEELVDASFFSDSAPVDSLFKPADESTWDILKAVPPKDEIDEYLQDRFQGFLLMARDDIQSLWARPAASCDSQIGKSIIVSLPAQTDLVANSKEDMATAYTRLDEMFPGFKLVKLDFATYAQSWNLQWRSFLLYKNYLFFGGELHRMMHSNDAIVHVYWEHIIKPCAILLNRNEVKLKFSAGDFNNKEQFVRLVAVAGFQWLVGLEGAPLNVLVDSAALLTAVDANLPARELIHFIKYAGTFALSDKASMRTASSPDLDWAWPYTTVLARACNKRNYAKYGIMMDKVINDTHQWAKVMMTKYRTFRVTGRPCTGVGGETCIEQVTYNTYLPTPTLGGSQILFPNQCCGH
jgi:hypothetical protein